MDLSSLPNLIPQMWNFLWPPVVVFAFLWYIAWLIFPGKTRLVTRLHELLLSLPEIKELRQLAEKYRVAKFSPLVGFFLVVFILYAMQTLVTEVGALLPGFVNVNKGVFVASFLGPGEAALKNGAAGDLEILDEFLALYSPKDDRDFNGVEIYDDLLASILDYQKQKSDGITEDDVGYWLGKKSDFEKFFNAVKFFILWTFLCALAAIVVVRHEKRNGGEVQRLLARSLGLLLVFLMLCYFCQMKEKHVVYREGLAFQEAAGVCLDKQMRAANLANADDFQGQAVSILRDVYQAYPHSEYCQFGWNKYVSFRTGRTVEVNLAKWSRKSLLTWKDMDGQDQAISPKK